MTKDVKLSVFKEVLCCGKTDMQLNLKKKKKVISNTSASNICHFCFHYTWRTSVNNYRKVVQEKMCSTTKI